MSDTMAAVLIVPFLIALAVALECTRTGCTWLNRRLRTRSLRQELDASAPLALSEN